MSSSFGNNNITSIPQQPGRVWGVLAIIAALIPMPFLLTLNILSLVVRSQDSSAASAERIVYGLIAVAGLFFFPLFFVLATFFGVRAVTRPRRVGKVMGWIAIAIVVLSIPAIWFGYLVWISPGA